MKNISSKKDFLLIKEHQQINEGLWNFLKNMTKNIKGDAELKKMKKKYKEEIEKVFNTMASDEKEKTAEKNVEKATKQNNQETQKVESKLHEAEMVGSDSNSDNDDKNDNNNENDKNDNKNDNNKNDKNENDKNDEKETLNKEQLQQKIELAKNRIKELKTNFNKEIEALKTKYKNKNGETPKKLEKTLSIANIEFSDWTYAKWQDYFKKIGNQKELKNIQNKRAENAKEMKKQTKELQHMIKGGEEGKRKFEIDTKYKYTNKDGDEKEITIKELENDGSVKNAELTNDSGETITINPFTDRIGDKIKDEEKKDEEKSGDE